MIAMMIECPLLKRLSSFPNSRLLESFIFHDTTSVLFKKKVKALSKWFHFSRRQKLTNLAEFALKD